MIYTESVTIMPDTTSPHCLNFWNQLMAIRLSSVFSHLWLGALHMFYKYATDITYITESGRKKNKQAWTWVSPKRKKEEVFRTFLAFLCICGYRERVSERNSRTATRNADSFSRTDRPGFWFLKFQLLLQQLALSDRRLSLTVANSPLFTALGPCLSSSSLCWFRAKTDKGILWLAFTHTHRTNRATNLITYGLLVSFSFPSFPFFSFSFSFPFLFSSFPSRFLKNSNH